MKVSCLFFRPGHLCKFEEAVLSIVQAGTSVCNLKRLSCLLRLGHRSVSCRVWSILANVVMPRCDGTIYTDYADVREGTYVTVIFASGQFSEFTDFVQISLSNQL